MAMVTEWIFTQKGSKTEAKCTRMQDSYGPISPDEHETLVELAEFIVNMVKRIKAEEAAEAAKETEASGGGMDHDQ